MHRIAIQFAVTNQTLPNKRRLREWARAALCSQLSYDVEMTIRIVDQDEMATLNSTYRQKNRPTNVLSFPLSTQPHESTPLLGDIVICAEIVKQEAQDQYKNETAHWAHMVVHGVFHLLGFDHIKEDDAAVMEALEIKVMHQLGFKNPYHLAEDNDYHD